MKSWKKRLYEELDITVPNLSDEVKYAPINANQNSDFVMNGNTLIRRRIAKNTIFFGTILILILGLLAIFGVFSSKKDCDYSIFTYEINPSVVFVTDMDGKVKSVKALNNDADIILSDEIELNNLINISLSESIVKYTETATKLGYLDLNKLENAVKLSGTEVNNELLKSASNSLKTYFCEKGIFAVVVEDQVSLQKLSNQLGMTNVSDFNELFEELDKLSVCFGERIDKNATTQQIENLYQTYILGSQLKDYVQNELLSNVTSIVKNAQMLFNISTLNFQITCHADNPETLSNYWELIKHDYTYTEDFKLILNEMESKLLEYKNTFNKEIESLTDLSDLIDAYSSFEISSLNQIFTNLSSADFVEKTSSFVKMLKNIGIDTSEIENLLHAPQDSTEYIEQSKLVDRILRNERIDEFKSLFEQSRESISETEYEDFVNNIKMKYGSLLEFWENK